MLGLLQRYGSEGLKLVSHEETVSFTQAVLKLTFDPGSPDDSLLTAECRLDHPFFVKNKGKIMSFPSPFQKKSDFLPGIDNS